MFLARSLRGICRIARKKTRLYHITNENLRVRVGVASLDAYVTWQQLRLAGHATRMSWNRLPRNILFSRVKNSRPTDAPQYTYGRGGIQGSSKGGQKNKETWFETASDITLWVNVINYVV